MNPRNPSPTASQFSGSVRPRRYFVGGLVALLALVAALALLPLERSGLPKATAAKAPAPQKTSYSIATIKKHYALAVAEYYAGEYIRAQSLFQGIADRVPGYLSDDIQFWGAECAFRLGDLERARNGFNSFLSLGSQGPRAKIAIKRLSLLKSWGG